MIAGTIERVARADYPADLIQILVICSVDDQGTIGAAAGKIQELRQHGRPTSTSWCSTTGRSTSRTGSMRRCAYAAGDVVTIFDAEDDIHPGHLQRGQHDHGDGARRRSSRRASS